MNKKEGLKEINIYELMKSLNEEEIWDLIFHSTSKEEATSYRKIADYLLQENQKKVIKEGIY